MNVRRRATSSGRNRIRLVVAMALAVVVPMVGAGPASAAEADIASAGPLTSIRTSTDLNCAVNHTGDLSGAFFDDTACGTFLVVDGTLYSPASVPAGSSAVGTPWTPVSQTAVTGAGTAGSPYQVQTVVAAGSTGVTVTQTDSYVVGQESFRTDVKVDNSGGARSVRLYRAADCFLEDSDTGLGSHDAGSGAVACESGTSDRILQWLPLSAGSHHYEAGFDEVWTKIGAKEVFPDTCRCAEDIDNGAGLSWDVNLAAGGSATRSSLITFSPTGALPLETTKTVSSPSAPAGGTVTYDITVHNPGSTSAALTQISDHLPAGFSYVAGSTSGASTANPSISGQDLTWAVSTSVPGGGNVTLSFDAVVSGTPGTYYNNASATATGLFVQPTGDTAPVAVTAAATLGPVTDLQAAGAGAGSVVLTWRNPASLDGIIVRYSTIDFPATATDGTGVPVAGTPETVTVNGLTDGTTYYFSVFATLGTDVSDPAFVDFTPFICPNLVPALDAGALVTGASWVACSGPNAHEPASTLSTLLPRTGATQALMTNGDKTVAQPPSDSGSEGADNGTGSRGAFDVSIYKVNLDVPAGSSCLRFDYVFASEEYPEYVGDSFNDGFLAQLDQNAWSVDASSVITATGNFARLAGGDFVSVNSSLFSDPARVTGPAGNGTGYDGMSVPLTASTPITPGAHSIYLSIFDAGDGVFDSAVLLDNLRVGSGTCSAGTNQAPLAVDDSATTTQNTAKTVNVLSNDSDVDGGTLSVTGNTQPSHGTVTCTASACTYTPAAGYTGSDSFTYTVSDGQGGSDTGTVTVNVTPATTPPSGADLRITKVAQDDPVAVGDLTGYGITVTNLSNQAATQVVVHDALPSGFKLQGTTSSQCTASGSTLTCQLGTVPAGGTVSFSITGAFVQAGSIANTATVSSANDPVAGNNAATDTVQVTGKTCTVVGTFGDDNPLLGTNHADVICGLAGDDRINAKGGDDTVYGNEGDDRIMGLGGDDLIDGGPGTDTTIYAAALQAIRVDLGEKKATGQGVDTFRSIENVTGSKFNDKITGDGAANLLQGLGGNDAISGLAGADKLVGGGGKDKLSGGKGKDVLKGGSGSDSCSVGGGGGSTASC